MRTLALGSDSWRNLDVPQKGEKPDPTSSNKTPQSTKEKLRKNSILVVNNATEISDYVSNYDAVMY